MVEREDKRVALVTVHGMGVTPRDYYRDFVANLQKILPAEVWQAVDFRPIYYQDLLHPQQVSVWDRMQEVRLDWKKMRQFALFHLSDAVAAGYRPDGHQSAYRRINERIADTLEQLCCRLRPLPIVLVANSLGCQVLSNYLWDVQHRQYLWREREPSDLEAARHARALFTSGCNIPLFVSGYAEENITAFARPHPDFRWWNYYDRDDVLGWPLRPLSPSYRDIVDEDIAIDIGSTPLSHPGYWKSKAFVRPIAKKLEELYRSEVEAETKPGFSSA